MKKKRKGKHKRKSHNQYQDTPSIRLDSDGTVVVSCDDIDKAARIAVRLYKKQARRTYAGLEYR